MSASVQPVKPIKLCVKYDPAIIGIVYKRKETDTKKRIYTILLQKLVLNEDTMEAAKQLYLEHPQFLSEKYIPVQQVADLIKKIQKVLQEGDEYDEDYEEMHNMNQKQLTKNAGLSKNRHQYDFEDDYEDDDPHAHLNRST